MTLSEFKSVEEAIKHIDKSYSGRNVTRVDQKEFVNSTAILMWNVINHLQAELKRKDLVLGQITRIKANPDNIINITTIGVMKQLAEQALAEQQSKD